MRVTMIRIKNTAAASNVMNKAMRNTMRTVKAKKTKSFNRNSMI